MPRYFFNVFDGRNQVDSDGEELPDKHAAWAEATATAGAILRDMDGRLKPGSTWRMEVTDEFRNPLYVIHIHAEQSR
jgi:hypothetical protein